MSVDQSVYVLLGKILIPERRVISPIPYKNCVEEHLVVRSPRHREPKWVDVVLQHQGVGSVRGRNLTPLVTTFCNWAHWSWRAYERPHTRARNQPQWHFPPWRGCVCDMYIIYHPEGFIHHQPM